MSAFQDEPTFNSNTDWLTYIKNNIFACLSNEDKNNLNIALLSNPTKSIELDAIEHKLYLFILIENIERIENSNIDHDLKSTMVNAITKISTICKTVISQNTVFDNSSIKAEQDYGLNTACLTIASLLKDPRHSHASGFSGFSSWCAARRAMKSCIVAAATACKPEETSAYKRYANELSSLLQQCRG